MTAIQAFTRQAESCAALGSPLTARLMTLAAGRLAPGTAVTDRILGWPGDISYNGDSVPLRLAGALHALVLADADPELAALYAAPEGQSDDRFWAIIDAALRRHEAHILHWLDSPPQTNEVRRSAILIAAGGWIAARFGLPLVLSELGASAGLNLLWDRYALMARGSLYGPSDPALILTPEWEGMAPDAVQPLITARAGVDLNPLDPVRDRLRILSYIWADQTDRLDRTKAALAEAARTPVDLTRADAADWLEARLATPFPGRAHMVFHTVAWQYFPAPVQDRCNATLAAAGQAATPDAPIAHFGMENNPTGKGTLLTMQVWPGGERWVIGTADAHGRRVHWAPPAA